MRAITISANDAILRRFGNQIGALGRDQAHKALARAVNRVTNTLHGRVVRSIRKQSDIPTAMIRKAVKKRLVSPNISHGTGLEGVVYAKGMPISLKHFKARQFSFGVKAKFNGKWHRFPSAFMGPRPGVVARRLGGHVWVRSSEERTPIEMVWGPSVPEHLVSSESERILQELVDTMLPARVSHEISRLLPH